MKKSDRIIAALGILTTVFGTALFIVSGFPFGEMKAERLERKMSASVNVMLQKPDDWKQIMNGRFTPEEINFHRIDGSTATIPITAELARQVISPDTDVYLSVDHNTTHVAYENLIVSKSKDLIFVTPPSDEETAMAAENGVLLKKAPVALDGFVFITHRDNPVDSLTIEQIQDIYSGKIKNWKQVGGNDEKITAYQREKNSGSQTAMEEFVMKGRELMKAPQELYIEGMGTLIESVAEYSNETCSIGYTYCYYMNNLYRNPDIKLIRINGTEPSDENLKNGSYPFTVPYYEIIRLDEPEDSFASELFEYMLTDEGQETVKQAGYCPAKEWKDGE